MANPRFKFLPFGIGKALDGIKQVDEQGRLYYMDYKANYRPLEPLMNKAAGAATPGCSTFIAQKLGGGMLFGRNYDFSHYKYNQQGGPEDITGLIVVIHCTNPRAKYKSLGIIDGFWLDAAKGRFFEGCLSDGKTDVSMFAMAPFTIMDGANEAGLAVSIMHLPTENEWIETDYADPESLTDEELKKAVIIDAPGQLPARLNPQVRKDYIAINTADRRSWKVNKNHAVNQTEKGKKTMIHPVLMRRMLDFAQNVDEAVKIARSVNVKSLMPDNDYHILVSDKSGRSVILEWVNNELRTKETAHGTNFYLTREDRYGYGYERDDILAACISKYKNGMSERTAMKVLELASQNSPEGSDAGFTQWSAVYDLTENRMRMSYFLDYERSFEYEI